MPTTPALPVELFASACKLRIHTCIHANIKMDESKNYNDEQGQMQSSMGMSEGGKMGESEGKGPAAALELEHAIGYSGMVYDSLVYHPNGQDFVYPAGGCLVVCDFNDPHNQVFLRGHDDNLSCVCVSRSGRIAATGQKGLNADVVVWSYGDGNDNSALYRFASTTMASHACHFRKTSACRHMRRRRGWQDFRVGLGNWKHRCHGEEPERHQGCQVRWHGEKREAPGYRDYQFITAGAGTLCYWVLSPQTGQLNCEKIPSRVQRNYTCAAWTDDYEMALVGSESGDFVYCMFPDKKNITVCDSVSACAGGVHSICASGTLADDTVEVTVGGGDGTVTIYKRDRRGFIDDAAVTLKAK